MYYNVEANPDRSYQVVRIQGNGNFKKVREVQLIMVFINVIICPHFLNGKCRAHFPFEK